MRQVVRCDRALIWTTLLLVLVGLVTVYTASADIAARQFGGSQVFLKRTAWRATLGLVAMAFGYLIDYRSYRKHAKKAILVAIGLLILTLLFGENNRGMRASLMMIQPGEVAKLALVVYLADVLARRQDELHDLRRGLLPRLGLVGAVVLLGLVMLFLGGAKLHHIAGLAAVAAPAAWLAVKNIPHIAERWAVWRATYDLTLDGLDTRGAAYQIYQSLVALGSGGLTGRGIGGSLQRSFIPDPYTDFAFSIWGEELGFLGAVALVALFAFLMVRGLRIAMRASDLYGTILAAGLTAMVTTYALINIAVATATIPTTGLPLPFVSYGGSSLIVSMGAMGILLNMSKRAVLDGGTKSSPEELARRWGRAPGGRRSGTRRKRS